MTINAQALTIPGTPPAGVLTGDSSQLSRLLGQLREEGALVRLVRGSRSATVPEFFNELSAALQFPLYFGHNWDAMDECLADMSWEPLIGGLVVLVPDADSLLASADDVERSTFASGLLSAWEIYCNPISEGEWWDRPAVGFSWVFQVTDARKEIFVERWRRGALPLEELLMT